MLDRISKMGISPNTPQELFSQISFSNLCSFYLAIACAAISPFYFWFGFEEMGLFLLPVSLAYAMVIFLNASGLYGLARGLLLFTFILGTFYYASRLGPEFAIQYLLIVGVVGIQMLFNSQEALWRNSLSVGTAFLWLFYESKINPIPLINTDLPPRIMLSIIMISVCISIFGSIALAFHFLRKEQESLKEALFIAEHDDLTYFGTQFFLKNQNKIRRQDIDYIIVVIEVHGLKFINEKHGWDFSNEVLKAFANAMRISFPHNSELLRLNGSQFGVWAPTEILEGGIEASLMFLAHELQNNSFPALAFSYGSAKTSEETDTTELLNIAQSRIEIYGPSTELPDKNIFI